MEKSDKTYRHKFKAAIAIMGAAALSACALPIKDPATQSSDGLVRLHESAVRDKNKKVITDVDKGQKRLYELKTVGKFYDDSIKISCSTGQITRSKTFELQAIDDLKVNQSSKALLNLAKADDECVALRYRTGREYYRAVALEKLGKHDEAKKSAQWFLDYASEVSPAIFEQGDENRDREFKESQKRDFELLRQYRQNADSYLTKGTSIDLIEHAHKSEVSKFPRKSFFSPGGNEQEGGFLIPGIGYSSISGFSFGASIYKSWGIYGIGVSGFKSAHSGMYYGLKFRRSLYESETRNINWDVYISAKTIKKLRYTYNAWDHITDVEVLDHGLIPGVGTGATYRFLPNVGVSSELAYYDNTITNDDKVEGSFYGNYYFNPLFAFVGGWMFNRPAVGFEFLFVQVVYDLEDEHIAAFIQGLSF